MARTPSPTGHDRIEGRAALRLTRQSWCTGQGPRRALTQQGCQFSPGPTCHHDPNRAADARPRVPGGMGSLHSVAASPGHSWRAKRSSGGTAVKLRQRQPPPKPTTPPPRWRCKPARNSCLLCPDNADIGGNGVRTKDARPGRRVDTAPRAVPITPEPVRVT